MKNLDFNYMNSPLIKNANFYVNEGEFVCIVGSNGVGKSTLLKLLLNILKPQSGTININGKSTNKNNHNKISYISQKATHFNQDFPATVKEIINLGLYGIKLSSKSRDKKIEEALTKVNMLNYKNKMIGKLSGGQQQRVFIAKALVSNPNILFLDEPITGIDTNTADSICLLLDKLNKNFKITIIMVTHHYHLLKTHATKLITINDEGNVIAETVNL